MKINLIIFISEFNLGGAGNSLFRLCKYLPKNLYNINVICLNKCAYKKELKENSINVYEIFSKKTSFAMFEVKKITEKIISKNYKKNIFISNIYYSNILSILFLRKLKMKIILVERTPFEELSIYFGIINLIKKKIMKFLIGFTYKYADMCISNSKYISNQYNKVYNLKFKTIYPPSFINIKNFKKKRLPKKKLHLATVCRLSEEKGLKNFLKIIPKLKFNFKFFIIGEGPDKQKLKKIASKLGIQKKIVFLGFLKPQKINIILKKIDLFINCSYFEGFPNSVVESLSSGVPVIASQSYGGINEILKEKDFGYIYKDKEDLIKNIMNFSLGKKKFNFSKKKVSQHLNNFSVMNNVKKYSKLFKEI